MMPAEALAALRAAEARDGAPNLKQRRALLAGLARAVMARSHEIMALLEIWRAIPRFSGAQGGKGFGRGHRGNSFTAASPESTAASMVAGRRGQVQSPASTRLR